MQIPSCPTNTENEIVLKIIPWMTSLEVAGRDSMDTSSVGKTTLHNLIDEAYQRGYRDGHADRIIESV